MGQTLQLQAPDGHTLSAYVAEPPRRPLGALVVVQEIFGVNPHIRSVVDGYAAEGYLAVAPALFDRLERGLELGYTEADVQHGMKLKAGAGLDQPLLDIAAAMAFLNRTHEGARVGILGYCWGGLLAWLAACRLEGLAAAVSYYGGGIPDHAALAPRCPVLAHFGEKDHVIPVPRVEMFRQGQPNVQVHLYPAGHGFNCDQRGSFDAPSARLARTRTLQFLAQHLL